jgi:hypothetical protein
VNRERNVSTCTSRLCASHGNPAACVHQFPYFDLRKAREKVSRNPESTDQERTILTKLRRRKLTTASSTLCASRVHARLANLEVDLSVRVRAETTMDSAVASAWHLATSSIDGVEIQMSTTLLLLKTPGRCALRSPSSTHENTCGDPMS